MIEILGELEPGHADTVTPAGPQPKCGQVRLHNPEHIGGIFKTFDQCVANPDPMGTGSGSNLKFNNSKKRTKIPILNNRTNKSIKRKFKQKAFNNETNT